MSRILRIEDVCYSAMKSNPVLYAIRSCGVAATSGWTDPHLSPFVYITPPDDGIQEFDFVATPPSGIVIPVETPIAATWEGNLPNWAKGIRIHSICNSKELLFADTSPSDAFNLRVASGEVPWPRPMLA